MGPAELLNESPRIFLTPHRVTSKQVIDSPGSASSQFTSFLSELPPSIVRRPPVDMQAIGVTPQAISSVQEKDSTSLVRSEGVLDHSISPHLVGQGTYHSNSFTGTRPVDREPTPSVEGVGAPQALIQPTQARASPSLLALPLDTTRVVSSDGSFGTHISKLSKKVLSRGKDVGFSFILKDELEVVRLDSLEERDCEASRIRESRSAVR